MAEAIVEKNIIFRTPDDEWGEFCNQYPSPFTYMGIRFETVEQFLFYMRAVFGRSKATADKVLACGGDSSSLAKTSKKQRILDNNSWDRVRPQMMRIGMRQKFLQNPELRKKLLGTGFRLLVEIPKEGLLGRILPPSEDWVNAPGKWKGKNTTGKALMQVRTDLRCADRLVGPDDAYVFPEELFVLKTPIGQMNLQEISMLPGAQESVRAYAETAQQYLELFLADADGFINRNKTPLVTMERAIASNAAEIEAALNKTKTAAEEAPAEGMAENAAQNINLQEQADNGADTDKLPDDIPAEGFYELLYDLDEMMKLGII